MPLYYWFSALATHCNCLSCFLKYYYVCLTSQRFWPKGFGVVSGNGDFKNSQVILMHNLGYKPLSYTTWPGASSIARSIDQGQEHYKKYRIIGGNISVLFIMLLSLFYDFSDLPLVFWPFRFVSVFAALFSPRYNVDFVFPDFHVRNFLSFYSAHWPPSLYPRLAFP